MIHLTLCLRGLDIQDEVPSTPGVTDMHGMHSTCIMRRFHFLRHAEMDAVVSTAVVMESCDLQLRTAYSYNCRHLIVQS